MLIVIIAVGAGEAIGSRCFLLVLLKVSTWKSSERARTALCDGDRAGSCPEPLKFLYSIDSGPPSKTSRQRQTTMPCGTNVVKMNIYAIGQG